jgi:hypothetical protein
MSLAARKSDVKSHLSYHAKRHILSPDSTSLSEKMGANEEGNGSSNLDTSISDADSRQRPSSDGVYAADAVVTQH